MMPTIGIMLAHKKRYIFFLFWKACAAKKYAGTINHILAKRNFSDTMGSSLVNVVTAIQNKYTYTIIEIGCSMMRLSKVLATNPLITNNIVAKINKGSAGMLMTAPISVSFKLREIGVKKAMPINNKSIRKKANKIIAITMGKTYSQYSSK